ncbi:hypothetical protein [Paramuribaculum intestinale]|uniref:hypothetical protein n=1 Tax=Paramuribaculum intestinale TaxID=2094151 RepID=UPI0025AA16FA|nr:hypothetical protein [Paramuribaculum intestinale]
MEQLDRNILYLQGFAPLIQLWAGICLLFFYESLLEESPFSTLCKEIKQLYDDFKNRYNGLIPADAISADVYVKDHWSSNFVPTIKCIASMCFFYSVFILAFIGIEGNSEYGGFYYCALQIMNTIVWIYLIGAIIFYKFRIFHGFISSIILSVVLLLYFHFHFTINNFSVIYLCCGDVWEQSSITIYTVFTCIGGILLTCFRLLVSWFILQCQKRSVHSINNKFRVFADYNLGRIKMDELPQKKLKRIMRICNEKFSKNEIQAIDATVFSGAMKDEIAKEYRDFTTRWWLKLY